jgi:hypothetical protein
MLQTNVNEQMHILKKRLEHCALCDTHILALNVYLIPLLHLHINWTKYIVFTEHAVEIDLCIPEVPCIARA